MSKKLIQFGAGNIGRSFIGQLFAQNGYEVVFVDINQKLIDELNSKGQYKCVIKKNNTDDKTLVIKNVRAIHFDNKDQILKEFEDAAILSTSVGKSALIHIIPIIAKGLIRRVSLLDNYPIDIIIAENLRNAADFLYEQLSKYVPTAFNLNKTIGMVETSIGKMVPIMEEADLQIDPLWVFAEEYNNLIVDKKGFITKIPDIADISAKDNISAYVDRKLFIHNLGHAAAAYFGSEYNNNFKYVYQALEIPEIYNKTKKCMLQSAYALNKEYPLDLLITDLADHIDDLLFRFQNIKLKDTIYRIGKDLKRKLDKNDRLTGALLLAKKHNCPMNFILKAFNASLLFSAVDQQGNLFGSDKDFIDNYNSRGLEYVINDICKLSWENELEKSLIDEIMHNKADNRHGIPQGC